MSARTLEPKFEWELCDYYNRWEGYAGNFMVAIWGDVANVYYKKELLREVKIQGAKNDWPTIEREVLQAIRTRLEEIKAELDSL